MKTLHNYQHEAINFIKTTKRCALHLRMGRGKTVITLTAISNLRDEFSINKVLIIAPLRVANNVWHNEILEWDHLKHLTFSILTGNRKRTFVCRGKNG